MRGSLYTLAAVALGLLLATFPFLQYLPVAHVGGGAHSDHSAHHGGIVGMVGDYHLELVVGTNEVSLYVSDAYRRPLHPRGGSIRFDDEGELPLAWDHGRLVGLKPRGPRQEAQCTAYLDDATVLSMSFVVGAIAPETGDAGR